ncbi:carbon storage regulator [bacterium]|jgi:carbon storage regulator|nr:carbon storage regulator [bacterium]
MLVLTRKVGDRIWIGDDICITVVSVNRGKVRVGIEAPRTVNVRRSELEAPEVTTTPVLVSCP